MGQTGSYYRPTSINDLTDDDLLKIFSYLNLKDKILSTRVCKRWRDLLKHPSIWKRIDVTAYKRLAHKTLWSNAAELQQVLQKHETIALEFLETYAGHSTTSINLGELVNNDILIHLRESCPNLVHIKLTKLVAKHPNIKLSLLPRNLRVINLRLISFREKHMQARISSHMRDFVVEPFLFLHHLSLDGATISCALSKQLSLSTKLSTLRLQSCVLRPSMTEDFEILTTQLNNLTQLDLAFCRFYTEEVLEVVLRCIAINLTSLRYCGFHCLLPSPHRKFDEFLKFISPDGSLVRLHLSGMQGITPRVFSEFTQRNQNLEILHLRFCKTINDESVVSIATNLQHLKELKLSGCRDISKHGYRQLAHHPSLQVLEIAEMNIALEAILFVARSLPCLIHLSLSPTEHKVCAKVLRKERPQLVVSVARLDYQEYLDHF
ncbi:uncharacterized protein [Amphiura filiformis]|uniref:uncharacterized protein n=1 Tax=Amphiura filiformis TaxID=82378 RepID=UPI003B226F8D